MDVASDQIFLDRMPANDPKQTFDIYRSFNRFVEYANNELRRLVVYLYQEQKL